MMTMDKTTINRIKEVVAFASQKTGWADLANVGTMLQRNDIDIRSFGYQKLKPLFEDLYLYFELSTNENTTLPIIRVRENKKDEECRQDTFLPQWSYIQLPDAIERLQAMALPETWSYAKSNSNNPYPILGQYLKWTFVKIYRENKIEYSKGYAAFNTGLVNKYYQPIFAIFDKNWIADKQPWHFIDFCVAGSSDIASRKLSDNFSQLPQRAVYIKNYDDVIYDCSCPVDGNWNHIIIENIERIPMELLSQVCSGGFEIKPIDSFDDTNKEHYLESLRQFLDSNPQRLSYLSHYLSMALDRAKLRVEWNYKTAIPIYYPRLDSVNLILPLSLNMNEPEEISLALVMRKTPAGRYVAVTIFTLDMAYSDARLIAKPSNDWLNPELRTSSKI